MAARRAVWLLLLPLAAVGWLTAHWLAYVLIAPDAHDRARLLSEAGYGYLVAAPAVVACAGTLLLAGLALGLVLAETGRIALAPDGTLEFASGQHDIEDYFRVDPSALDPLCAALAAG